VTHQGSPPARQAARLPAESKPWVGRGAERADNPPEAIRCHRCGRVCEPWLRLTTLSRGSDHEAITWPPPRGGRARAP
jgi:hypothetical protein